MACAWCVLIVWPILKGNDRLEVEVCLTRRTSQSFDLVKKLVYKYLIENYPALFMPLVLTGWESAPILRDCVEKIIVSESGAHNPTLRLPRSNMNPQHAHIEVFRLRSAHYGYMYTDSPRTRRSKNYRRTPQTLPKSTLRVQ